MYSDTFRWVFEKINPSGLSSCLINWVSAERSKRSVVAVDGKTIRGNANGQHKAYHVVSAFVAENQITLGEINVEEICRFGKKALVYRKPASLVSGCYLWGRFIKGKER